MDPLPWNDPEYVRFVQALDSGGEVEGTGNPGNPGKPSEVYQSLIDRETRALDTVDRVVNDARKTALASTRLVDMPVRALASRTLRTGIEIMDDLVEAGTASDVRDALLSGDRKVFVGSALVVVAIAAALVASFSTPRLMHA